MSQPERFSFLKHAHARDTAHTLQAELDKLFFSDTSNREHFELMKPVFRKHLAILRDTDNRFHPMVQALGFRLENGMMRNPEDDRAEFDAFIKDQVSAAVAMRAFFGEKTHFPKATRDAANKLIDDYLGAIERNLAIQPDSPKVKIAK